MKRSSMINILNRETIDKIAAGEVVERPESVVKELLENAIDSGADSVSVEIREGGLSLIRVTDNGCGIEKEDIPLAFLRHATSKLASASDLLHIRTMGFRGEALASISGVSEVEMITKTKASMFGCRYRINGGQEQELTEIGAPEGTESWEFDYPTGSDEGATNTFEGDGGPSVGNIFSRLLYAVRFGSEQILFSDRVTSESQILYDRSPRERVAKVAPYLTLDGRVYPAVVDGRVKWIIDGYTTSDAYPYSQMTDLGAATEDSTTETSQTVQGLNSQQANYIRNSVKATVDAYDGSVDLYVWDEDDPVIKAWQQIFPGQYHSLSEISGDLMSHMRYPESLFKVQRQLLERYHVSSASQFFSGEDFWQTPNDPTASSSAQSQGQSVLQPPYYLTLQTGGSSEPVFSLTSTYIPAGSSTREILTGFLSVDSDAGNEAGVIGEHYGTIRLQELPQSSNVPGPGQAQNNFNANADVSRELNLLESGSTSVERGNLLTLPLGGGLVYVQPVYVRSSGATSYPMLQKVLVAFGDQVGFADTLDEALDQVFGGDSGASAGDAENAGEPGSQGSTQDDTASQDGESGDAAADDGTDGQADGSGSTPNGGGSGAATGDLKAALDDAAQAMKDSDAALKDGDWTAYGEAQDRLEEAINKALELGN